MIVCISRSTGTRLSSTISRRGASGLSWFSRIASSVAMSACVDQVVRNFALGDVGGLGPPNIDALASAGLDQAHADRAWQQHLVGVLGARQQLGAHRLANALAGGLVVPRGAFAGADP